MVPPRIQGPHSTPERNSVNEVGSISKPLESRLMKFTDVETKLLLSAIEDYAWAIGHRGSYMSEFLMLRSNSWTEVACRVNFFGHTDNAWTPKEMELKWGQLLKASQEKVEGNKAREVAIEAHQAVDCLFQPLTTIDRRVLYLEEHLAWGTEMDPFLGAVQETFAPLRLRGGNGPTVRGRNGDNSRAF